MTSAIAVSALSPVRYLIRAGNIKALARIVPVIITMKQP
jgi:hypothetical protein